MPAGVRMTMPTASKQVVINNRLGLHARPAMQFVDLANRFASSITVCKPGDATKADGKSVMQMIILAAVEGTPLTIEADGEDAQQAVEALAGLVDQGFHDEE
jgi:phosphocarrier protein